MTSIASAAPASPLRLALRSGPVLMVLATLAFCLMVAAVKVARTELSPLEIIVWRGVVAAPFATAIAWQSGFRMGRIPVFLLRAGLGFVAMLCFFTAAKGLPLADLALVSRLQPVMVALIAPVALGASERAGPMLWIAMGLGLAGCAVIVGPEMAGGAGFGLWALAATLASAGAHTAVRALGRSERPRTVVFWFQITNLGFALSVHLALTGALPALPPSHLVGAVVACGVTATVGQLLMTQAYKQDSATVVAAASYASPVWSVLLDLALFGIVPGWTVAVGGALVIAAGYALYRARHAAPAAEREITNGPAGASPAP